jgi:hypothetical protein
MIPSSLSRSLRARAGKCDNFTLVFEWLLVIVTFQNRTQNKQRKRGAAYLMRSYLTKMEFVTINGIFRSFGVGAWEGLMSEGVLVDSDIRTELQ